MKRTIAIVWGLAVVGAVAAQEPANPAFVNVERSDLSVTVRERGSLDAANVKDLACEIKARGKDGIAANVKWLVAEGSKVKKGDRVAELDAPVVRDELRAAAGDAARVKALEAELEKCVLKAPMDGVAVYYVPPTGRLGPGAPIAVGDTVKEGQKLVQVVDLRKMIVTVRVAELGAQLVKVGQTAQVQVDAFAGKPVAGKVTRAGTQPEGNKPKLYPVTIALDDTRLPLKPQMSADVWIAAGERKGVLLVHVKAVAFKQSGAVCLVKDGDKVIERAVKTAATDGTRIEIVDGLKEGETVLAEAAKK